MLHLFSGELERLADFFPQFWGCVRGEGSEGHTSSEAVEVRDVLGLVLSVFAERSTERPA